MDFLFANFFEIITDVITVNFSACSIVFKNFAIFEFNKNSYEHFP